MHKYMVIDNFVTPRDANDFIDLIDDITFEREGWDCYEHELQTIIEMPQISEKLWKRIRNFIFNYGLGQVQRGPKRYQLIGLSDSVTLSRHITPIDVHRDKDDRTKFRGIQYNNVTCLYKIAIYLNEVNENPGCKAGGTTLYDDDQTPKVTVAPRRGRALIFDIRDLHSGAPIPPGKMKYLIGFRLLYREV